jgi:hypothetical protein
MAANALFATAISRARGHDRYRPCRGPPAPCPGSRGCRWRSRPHSFLACNSAALHAALEVDRDAAADPLSEGHLDGDFSEALAALLGKDAPGLSPTAIIRLEDGRIDEHDAWQKRDLSAKRYVYV